MLYLETQKDGQSSGDLREDRGIVLNEYQRNTLLSVWTGID